MTMPPMDQGVMGKGNSSRPIPVDGVDAVELASFYLSEIFYLSNQIVTYTKYKQRSFNIFYLLLVDVACIFFLLKIMLVAFFWIKKWFVNIKNPFCDMKTVRHNVCLSFLSFMPSMYRKILLCKYPLLPVAVCLVCLANMVSKKQNLLLL